MGRDGTYTSLIYSRGSDLLLPQACRSASLCSPLRPPITVVSYNASYILTLMSSEHISLQESVPDMQHSFGYFLYHDNLLDTTTPPSLDGLNRRRSPVPASTADARRHSPATSTSVSSISCRQIAKIRSCRAARYIRICETEDLTMNNNCA